MKKLSLLILLGACSGHPSDGGATVDASATNDVGYVVNPPQPVDPDLGCVVTPPSTIAVDPMMLGGSIVEVTTAGVTPVDDVDVALFRAGEPVVLARTSSGPTGAFSTGAVVSGGHAIHAYLKATKQDYRTAFFYPPVPFAANSSNLVVPTISNSLFETVSATFGATQDDTHNGVLLVAVLDCAGTPIAGATLSVRRGANQVGDAHDLGSIAPGTFLVFNVPDGKVFVSASYNGTQLPEHDVMVRAKDPDCATARGTLTSTIVRP